MTDQSEGQSQSSARGEAAWKLAREAVAARNRRAQKVGREQRQAHERQQANARRAADARADARLANGAERAGQTRKTPL